MAREEDVSALRDDFRASAFGLPSPDNCSALYDAPRFGLEAVLMPLFRVVRGLARARRGVKFDIGGACSKTIIFQTPTPLAAAKSHRAEWR